MSCTLPVCVRLFWFLNFGVLLDVLVQCYFAVTYMCSLYCTLRYGCSHVLVGVTYLNLWADLVKWKSNATRPTYCPTGRVGRRRYKTKDDGCLLLSQIAEMTDDGWQLANREDPWMLKLIFAGFFLFFFCAPPPMRFLLLCIMCFMFLLQRYKGFLLFLKGNHRVYRLEVCLGLFLFLFLSSHIPRRVVNHHTFCIRLH